MTGNDYMYDALVRKQKIFGDQKAPYDKVSIASEYEGNVPSDVNPMGLMSPDMNTKQPVRQTRDYPKVDMGNNYVPVAGKDYAKKVNPSDSMVSIQPAKESGMTNLRSNKKSFKQPSILEQYGIGKMK